MQIKFLYNNNNPIFLNPSSKNEWSIKEITVNTLPYVDEIKSDIVEVNLTLYKFKLRDTVNIQIRYYKSIGLPILINQYDILHAENFSFTSVFIDKKNEVINWEVDAFRLSGRFELQQYRWNEWNTMDVVKTQNNPLQLKYSAQSYPHSGKNLFRIIYLDSLGNTFYSTDIKYTSKNQPIQIINTKVKNTIEFSAPTYFQLFDSTGTLIYEGFEKSFSVANLPKGKYLIRFDNTSTYITKK